MWIKLDDGIATHPKILEAGILALGIQIRAICYCSKNKTDGYVSCHAVPLLLTGLDDIGLLSGRSGQDANEFDWPTYMVDHGLWEAVENGYCVHDYLDWNISKKEYEKIIKKLSLSGRKGAKLRWNKEKSNIALAIATVIAHPIASTSTSTSTLNPLNSPKSEEPDWFQELQKNPLYAHIDFARELAKVELWKSKPKNRHRKITRDFLINWLNKIEPPLTINGNGTTDRPPPPPPKNDPIGRGQWGRTYGNPKDYGYD